MVVERCVLLECLNVTFRSQLVKDGAVSVLVGVLRRLPELTTVGVTCHGNLEESATDAILSAVTTIGMQLRCLSLGGFMLRDDHLLPLIAACPRLQDLALRHDYHATNRIQVILTDQFLLSLADTCRDLAFLNLSGPHPSKLTFSEESLVRLIECCRELHLLLLHSDPSLCV